MGLFYWFRQGYEVEVKHIPLDLMARIGRDVSKEVQDLDLATCSASAGADQPSFSLSGPIFSRTSNKQHHRLSSEEIGGGAGAGKGKGKELVSFSTPPKSQSLAIIGSSSSNSNIVKDTLEPITSSSPSSPTSSCSSPHVGDGGSNYNKLIPRKPSSRSLNIRETLRGNIKDSIKKRSSSSTLASKASFTGLELTDTLRTSSRQEGVVAGEVVEVDESVSSSPIASKSSLPLSINNNANDNAVAPVSGIGGASPPTPFSKRFLLFPDKRLNEGEVESGGHGKSNKNRRFSMLHTFANVTTTPRDANLFEVPTSAEDEENEKTSTSVGGRAVDELEEEDDLRPAVSPYPIPSPRHVDIEAQHDDHLSYTNPSSPTHPLSAGVHYLPTPVQRGILNSYYAETDQNIVTSKAMHLEPPMTRVPGILDVPLESSIPIIPDLDEEDFMMQEEGSDVTDEHQLMVGGPPASSTSSGVGRKYVRFPALTKKQPLDMDLTLYTYLHPALIGRLPIAWLASTSRSGGEGSSNSTVEENSRQPRRLVEAREEQKQLQADFKRKLTERVRLGAVYAAAASGVRCEEVEEEDEEDDEGSSGEDQEDEEEVLLVEEDGAELTQTESDPLLGATSGDGGGGSSTTTGAANQTRDKQSRKKKRSPRTRRRTRRNRNNHRSIDVLFTSRVRSFFDGLTSWAHLQLS